MKLYRIFPKPENHQAYLALSGISFDVMKDLIYGKELKNVDCSKIEIKNKTKKITDFIGSGKSEFFINEKLKELLIKYVKNQELNFLQTNILNKEYWLLNIVGLRDCMDKDKSKFTVFEANGEPDEITNLTVHETQINEYDIFRIKEKPLHIFITEALKEELEKQQVSGLKYIDSMNLTYH